MGLVKEVNELLRSSDYANVYDVLKKHNYVKAGHFGSGGEAWSRGTHVVGLSYPNSWEHSSDTDDQGGVKVNARGNRPETLDKFLAKFHKNAPHL